MMHDRRSSEIQRRVLAPHTLGAQIDSANWAGPDADTFRGDWAASYRTQLTAVASALRDAATRANNNATQQAETSAV
jgi:hypothetical protein